MNGHRSLVAFVTATIESFSYGVVDESGHKSRRGGMIAENLVSRSMGMRVRPMVQNRTRRGCTDAPKLITKDCTVAASWATLLQGLWDPVSRKRCREFKSMRMKGDNTKKEAIVLKFELRKAVGLYRATKAHWEGRFTILQVFEWRSRRTKVVPAVVCSNSARLKSISDLFKLYLTTNNLILGLTIVSSMIFLLERPKCRLSFEICSGKGRTWAHGWPCFFDSDRSWY